MKLTIGDVFDAFLGLEMTKARMVPMPDKAKYWLSRLARKLRSDFQDVNDRRDELIKSYGKKNEQGQFYTPPEVQEDFNKKWVEMRKEELEVEGIDRRPLSFFRLKGAMEDSTDGPLSIGELVALDPFITDDTEGAAADGQTKH